MNKKRNRRLAESFKYPASVVADHHFENRWKALTPNVRRVAELTVFGFSAQQVAGITGRSLKTIEVQRHQALKKMECESSVNLTKGYWCLRMREELQEEMRPMVIRCKRGNTYVYYTGVYDPLTGHPATSTDPDKAAEYAGLGAADQVRMQLNGPEQFTGIWETVPRQRLYQEQEPFAVAAIAIAAD